MPLSKVDPNFVSQTPYGKRNLIINGAMEVAQRGTSHTTSVSTGYHTVDRIDIGGSGTVGQWTSSQDTDAPAGFYNSFKLECTTAYTSLGSTDHYGIMYMPEGHHMNPVGKGTSGAKSMTLSFYLKANVTKTMVVELTDASNSRHVNFTVTPSATNTWERIILNIPADTSGGFNAGTNSKAAELNFWLASGTNYTSGSNQSTWTSRTAANIMPGVSNWADTVGNTIWITGLQLEVGDTATPFEHRSYADELLACQRYYAELPCFSGPGTGTTDTRGYGAHVVQMRAAPTLGVTGVMNITDGYSYDRTQSSASISLITNTVDFSFFNLPNFSSMTGGRIHYGPRNQNANRVTLDSEL